jgi:septal ring factor EnvC (AmiA/AmiB activator)
LPSHNDDVDASTEKLQRNNAAARKYRQKFVERIAELEKALAEVSAERDQLKLKLVRSDAEVEVLRGFVEKLRK